MQNDIDKDLYEILGIDRSADQDDIKRAYRAKAREHHPDVADHDDAEYMFKEVTFAYEILSDPEKRRDYDAFGIDGLRRGAPPGADFSGFTTFSDLIDMFFGGGFGGGFSTGGSRRPRVNNAGRDMETVLMLTLGEVNNGAKKKIDLRRGATCSECLGSGCAPGAESRTCATCNGTGQVRTQRRSFIGTIVTESPCTTCNTRGEIIEEPCKACRGEGRRQAQETIEVSVPPGVDRGDRLLVRHKGEGGGRGAPDGDLYVYVDVKPHSKFTRDGHDLYTTVTVDMVDAALGKKMDIDTLDGEQELKLRPGTQPGEIVRMKAKGLPARGGGRKGDIIVTVEVSVPKKLSGEEKKLLERVRDSRQEKASK